MYILRKKAFMFLVAALFWISGRAQTNSCQTANQFRVVVLGSSTAAGTGPSSSDSAWVNRFRTQLQSFNSNNEVINLAIGGTTTYHIMPDGFSPSIGGRPSPNSIQNITKALSYNPDGIIINMPSNDASNGFTPAEQLFNFDSIVSLANANGVPVWICTTQPRNGFSSTKVQWQQEVNDSLLNRYGNFVIDFWTGIATAQGTIEAVYNAGDGIHLNNAGHWILFNRVKDKNLLDVFCGGLTTTVDYGLKSIGTSEIGNCGNPNQQFYSILKNYGINDTSSITVHFNLRNLNTNTVVNGSQVVSSGLDSLESDTLYFMGNTSESGSYEFNSWITTAFRDSNFTNDSLLNTFQIIGLPNLSVFNDTVCLNDSATLHAQVGPNDSVYWFNQAVNGTLLFKGNSYLTPPISSSTTYYAQGVRGTSTPAGSDTLESTYNSDANWNGVMFDIIGKQPIVLDSLSIKVFTLGIQEVEIYKKTGTHRGYEANGPAWTLHRTDTVNIANQYDIANVSIDGLSVKQGDTIGIYIKLKNHIGKLSYLNTPLPVTKSDSKVELFMGTGITHNWQGSFYPRVWNGTLFYSFGSGSSGSCPTNRLPVIASNFTNTQLELGNDTSLAADDSLLIDAGTFDAYSWSNSAVTSSILFKSSEVGTGIHLLFVTVTDSNGCSFSDSLRITVLPPPPPPPLPYADLELLSSFPSNPINCGDSSLSWALVVSNAGIADTADIELHISLLNTTASTTQSLKDTIIGGLSSLEKDTVLFQFFGLNAGNYQLSAFIESHLTDTNSTNDSLDATFVIQELPELITISDTLCTGDTATLIAFADSGSTVSWFDDAVSGNLVGTGTQLAISTASTTTVYAQTVLNGCTSSRVPASVVVNALPNPDLGADTSIEISQSLSLNPGLFLSYLWSDNSTGNNLNIAANTYSEGTYQISVQVENTEGCRAADTLELIVLPPVSTNNCANTDLLIVVMGSSTPAGFGPSVSDSSWVNRFKAHLKSVNSNNDVVNLAIGGTTTYHLMPDGFQPSIANRPSPNSIMNITKALSYQPDGIIVNVPIEDASAGYLSTEVLFNYDSILSLASSAGVPVWFCTPQPKNWLSSQKLLNQWQIRDTLLNNAKYRGIDFWNGLAQTNGYIIPAYASGGFHLNNNGHWVLFNRVINKGVVSHFCGNAVQNTSDYAISIKPIVNFNPCGDSLISAEVIVTNQGGNGTDDVPIKLNLIHFPTNQSLVLTDLITGGLDSLESDTIAFQLSAMDSGRYEVTAHFNSFSDSNSSNDSVSIQFNVIGSPQLYTINDTVCAGNQAILTAMAGNDSIKWYDSLVGGQLLANSSNLSISSAIGNELYYAEASRGNCKSERIPANVELNSNLAVNLGSDIIVYPNDTLIINAGNFNSYLWSDSSNLSTFQFIASPALEGHNEISVRVEENGCFGYDTIVITVQDTFQLRRFNVKTIGNTSPTGRYYAEYLPPGFDTAQVGCGFPMLLVLHGNGQKGPNDGSELGRVTWYGPAEHIKNGGSMCFTVNGKKECFVVIAPQLSVGNWTPEIIQSHLNAVLNDTVVGSKIDQKRIYLTGLSLGGQGTYWHMINPVHNSPNSFAAFAPVAGNANPNIGCSFSTRNVPMWAFHGKLDTIVPYAEDSALYSNILNCNNPQPSTEFKFTTYQDLAHNAWDRAYDTSHTYQNPNLYEWFLSKTLPMTTNNCSNTAAVSLNKTQACSGDTILATFTTPGYNHVYWELDSVHLGSGTSIQFNPSNGNHLLRVYATDCDCPIDTSILINIIPASASSILASGPAEICSGDSVLLSSDTAFGNQWFFNGVAVDTNSSIYAKYSGTYSLAVQSSGSCADTSSFTLLSNLPISPTITPIGNVLESSDAMSYQWYFNDSLLTGETSKSILPLASGKYGVLTSDSNGCFASDTLTYQVFIPAPPVIDYAIIQSEALNLSNCLNPSLNWKIKVRNQEASDSSDIFLHVIIKNLTANSSVSYQDSLLGGLNNNQSDSLFFNLNASDSGNYEIVAYIDKLLEDSKQSNDTLKSSFTVHGIPALTLTGDTVCMGEIATLTGSSDPNVTIYWYNDTISNQAIDSGNTLQINTTSTIASYFANASRFGCSSAVKTAELLVNSLPNPNLGSDTSLFTNDSILLSTGSYVSYSWSDSSSLPNLWVRGSTTGIGSFSYSVMVTNTEGCQAADTISVNFSDPPPPVDTSVCEFNEAYNIVVMGSSTPAGFGPSVSDSSWVNRYRAYLKSLDVNNDVINIAIGGTTTYHLMPSGTSPAISGRPSPNAIMNITKALSYSPNGIIINVPFEDVSQGFLPSEVLNNYASIVSVANAAGAAVWICTPQPKNWLSNQKLQRQFELIDSVTSIYGNKSINFWDGLAQTNGYIISNYAAGGFHLNNNGHWILFNRVLQAEIPKIICEESSTVALRLKPDQKPSLLVYPNPNEGNFNLKLELEGSSGELIIFNQLGQVVYQNQLKNEDKKGNVLEISGLAEGYYFARYTYAEGSISKKILVSVNY